MKETFSKQIDIFKSHSGIMRTGEALEAGISPRDFYAMRDQGIIIQLSRGLYRLAEESPIEEPDWVIISKKIPKAVICLISALNYYEYTNEIPNRVNIALPQKAEKPRIAYPPLWIVWLSENPYSTGIDQIEINQIPVKIYNLEKTIADCIKFRGKIGEDTAIQALKQYLTTQGADLNRLYRYAKINRVQRVMQTFINTMK